MLLFIYLYEFMEVLKIAREKASALESRVRFYVRFVNFCEFKDLCSMRSDADYSRAALHIPVDQEKSTTFAEFKGKNPLSLSMFMNNLTRWDTSSEAPCWYDCWAGAYARILAEAREQKSITNPEGYALRKFRLWFLKEIATQLEFKIADGSGFRFPTLEELGANIPDFKLYYAQKYKRARSTFFSQPRHDFLFGLLDDPDFLVKNKAILDNILLAFSPGMFLSMIEEQRPYHVLLFLKEERFRYGGGLSYFGHFVPGQVSDVFSGALVTIPSRKICADAVELVQAAAAQDPNNAIPIYDSLGNLFWPQ